MPQWSTVLLQYLVFWRRRIWGRTKRGLSYSDARARQLATARASFSDLDRRSSSPRVAGRRMRSHTTPHGWMDAARRRRRWPPAAPILLVPAARVAVWMVRHQGGTACLCRATVQLRRRGVSRGWRRICYVCDGILECYILRRKGDSNVLDAEPMDPSRFIWSSKINGGKGKYTERWNALILSGLVACPCVATR